MAGKYVDSRTTQPHPLCSGQVISAVTVIGNQQLWAFAAKTQRGKAKMLLCDVNCAPPGPGEPLRILFQNRTSGNKLVRHYPQTSQLAQYSKYAPLIDRNNKDRHEQLDMETHILTKNPVMRILTTNIATVLVNTQRAVVARNAGSLQFSKLSVRQIAEIVGQSLVRMSMVDRTRCVPRMLSLKLPSPKDIHRDMRGCRVGHELVKNNTGSISFFFATNLKPDSICS